MSYENPEYFKKSDDKSGETEKGKVVCAWCKKEMGEKEGLKEGQISHGICDDCRKKYFPKTGQNKL